MPPGPLRAPSTTLGFSINGTADASKFHLHDLGDRVFARNRPLAETLAEHIEGATSLEQVATLPTPNEVELILGSELSRRAGLALSTARGGCAIALVACNKESCSTETEEQLAIPKLRRIDPERLLASVLGLHQRLYQASGGWLGARLGQVHCLLLHTVGRRSGMQRTVALAYVRQGTDYILVASNNGSDRPPQWLENLRAHPEVELQVARERLRGVARVVERGAADYERLLRAANANVGWRYFHYQQRTNRPIPVVVVTPAPGTVPTVAAS